jgi:hypothetical protein
MFEALRNKGYQIEFVSHALAILEIDFPDAATELEEALLDQSVPIEEIIGSGGGETKGTQRLRNGLTAKKWLKETFTIKKTINDEPRESTSHKVDHVRVVVRPDGKRYRIALEIEWNNKDPFFDRDLEKLPAKRAKSLSALNGSEIQFRFATPGRLTSFRTNSAQRQRIGANLTIASNEASAIPARSY